MPRAYGALKKKLEDESVRLRGEIQQLGTLREERFGYGNHMADDATEVYEQTKDLSLRESQEDTLKRVERALERFDEGSYGVCEDCGSAIEWGRLKVLPYTRHCVGCVRRHERES
jgi:DnaK suppressor protein